jgi:hypothetical protein
MNNKLEGMWKEAVVVQFNITASVIVTHTHFSLFFKCSFLLNYVFRPKKSHHYVLKSYRSYCTYPIQIIVMYIKFLILSG